MSQITLRGLDPEIERKLRRMANEKGKSLNRIVLEMINNSAGSKKKPPADSLRKLAGGWTDREADQFNESIKICEQIDEALWR